jgi:hypothetical protein
MVVVLGTVKVLRYIECDPLVHEKVEKKFAVLFAKVTAHTVYILE